MSNEFKMPEGWECRSKDSEVYSTPCLTNEQTNLNALRLLKSFDGLPAPVIRQVLRQTLFWLDAVTVLNCGEATEYARAVEGWRRAAGESR